MRRGENFPLLDGLRGVAALAVVQRHGHEFLLNAPDHASDYLAVDFFFLLSGFVVCAAYGRRLENHLSWRRFMTIRLIRLWPMLVIGGLLGGVSLCFYQAMLGSSPVPWNGMVEGICDALLIPLGVVTRQPLFAGNVPIWSLFFEILVNALYGWRVGFSTKTWIRLTAVWAAILVFLAWRFGSLNLIGFMGPLGFLGGFPRALVPFSIGVIIYRTNLHHRLPPLSAWLPTLLLIATLYCSFSPAWVFDLTASLLIFPVLVTVAAASRLGPRAARLSYLSGELSYPVYLLHEPILRMISMIEIVTGVVIPYALNLALAVAIILLTAWLLLKFVDKPVRRALDRLLLGNKDVRGVMVEPAL